MLIGWKDASWEITVVVKRQDLLNNRLVALARESVERESKASVEREKFYREGIKRLLPK